MPPSTGFIGKHELKIDAKGRITMPARFKTVLREKYPDDKDCVVVRLSLDLNLMVEPASEYAKVADEYEQYDDLDEDTRKLKATITGLAAEEKIDAGGRIRLSADLRQIVGLNKEVTLIGHNRAFEIWDSARWQENQAATLREFKALTERVRLKNSKEKRG